MPCLISSGREDQGGAPALLSLGQALVLGLLHGPAELLPISSSGHVTAVPWLLGWPYPDLDPELRKAFEVALHGGSAVAWILSGGQGSRKALGPLRRRGPILVLMTLPPAMAGLVLEGPIERRLGRPPTIAVGLLAGALAMAAADRSPQGRRADQATPVDGLLLGLAQTCALFPGISRSGAALTVARWRRFSRPDAWQLSMHGATPVIAGATALKLMRLVRPGGRAYPTSAMCVGAGGSFGSSLALSLLLRPVARGWGLLPFALYRTGLALAILTRLERSGQVVRG